MLASRRGPGCPSGQGRPSAYLFFAGLLVACYLRNNRQAKPPLFAPLRRSAPHGETPRFASSGKTSTKLVGTTLPRGRWAVKERLRPPGGIFLPPYRLSSGVIDGTLISGRTPRPCIARRGSGMGNAPLGLVFASWDFAAVSFADECYGWSVCRQLDAFVSAV